MIQADLLAVIDKAEAADLWEVGDVFALMRAILDLHQPVDGTDWCDACYGDWPCLTVDVVADALTRMGALPTVVDATHDMRIDDPLRGE